MVVSSRLEPVGPAVKEVRAVRNSCAVIETVALNQPVGVSELARITGLDKSAVQRIVVTLHSAGWLAPAAGATTRWEIPPSNPLFRFATLSSLERLVGTALDQLRDLTGETVILVTKRDSELIISAASESRQPFRLSPTVGHKIPFDGSAAGAAIAAMLPSAELRFVQEQHPTLTARKLGHVRRLGWAANDREVSEGVRSVAAAVTSNGYPVAALAVCGPASRVSSDDLSGLGPMVVEAARVLTEARDLRL